MTSFCDDGKTSTSKQNKQYYFKIKPYYNIFFYADLLIESISNVQFEQVIILS